MGARKRERRRLADRLVSAAWASHDFLHNPELAARPDVILNALRRWSLGNLRDANRMARLCGAEPLTYQPRAGAPTVPTLRAIKGGKAGA